MGMIYPHDEIYHKLIFRLQVKHDAGVTGGSVTWGLSDWDDDLTSPLASPTQATDTITLTCIPSTADDWVTYTSTLDISDLGLIDGRLYEVDYSLTATGTYGRIQCKNECLMLEEDGHLYVNPGGESGAYYIYFYDGTATAKWLRYDNLVYKYFTFNDSLDVTGHITASGNIAGDNLAARDVIYVNSNGPNGDSYLYFWDDIATGQYIKWDDNPGEFVFSADINIDGDLSCTDVTATSDCTAASIKSNGNAYVNYNGPDGDSNIYFYDGGGATGQHFGWDNAPGEFVLTDALNIAGKCQCDSFRIDQTPSAGAPTPDKYITISCNGTDYKVPVEAV